MKEKPTHYYCLCTNNSKPKNKLQEEFLTFLKSMDMSLYEVDKIEDLKVYIFKKAEEINKKYSRCAPLQIYFIRYTNYSLYLEGFEAGSLHLREAHLIDIKNGLK